MHNGDFVMTQRTLIAESGDEVSPGIVGQVEEIGGVRKIAVKLKGEVVFISDFNDSDFVEVW